MDGFITNYKNFKETPFDAFYGDISSAAEATLTLVPGFKVKLIANTPIRFRLSNTAGDIVDYTNAGSTTYVPANTYFEFEAHMLRKYFYCKATTSTTSVFVNLTYITGLIN
jgi:hypothetical protein